MKLGKRKRIFGLAVLVLVGGVIFMMTFMRTPAQVAGMMQTMARELSSVALVIHMIFAAALVTGLLAGKSRNTLFPALLMLLSGSATSAASI